MGDSKYKMPGYAGASSSTLKGLIRELDQEEGHWAVLSEALTNRSRYGLILSNKLDRQRQALATEEFNEEEPDIRQALANQNAPIYSYPYRNSDEGILLAKVFEAEGENEAAHLLVAYYIENGWIDNRMIDNQHNLQSIGAGATFGTMRAISRLQALRTVRETAPVRISSQKLTAEIQAVREKKDGLDAEIDRLRSVGEGHQRSLEEIRQRSLAETQWRHKVFHRWSKRVRAVNHRASDEWNAKYEETHNRYVEQLQFKAPVELWKTRSETHSRKARWALARFLFLVAAAIISVVLVIYYGGDYIAGTFVEETCAGPDLINCSRSFSPKGIFTTSSVLLVTSLVLWVVRLQSKVYLSERHLFLDAEEKKAFAETYLALLESGSAARDNEAIVLATLFRPTQDGIVKDEGGGFDASSAALLARQLSKPN